MLVSGATAFSRVLGLVREQVMAYLFGASMATDAFLIAFRIPNLLRDMFAEGALSSAFVPVFKERIINDSEEEAFGLANIVFTGILIFVGAIVLLGIISAPLIIYISANGFTADPAKFDLTVGLTRLMFVYLLLVSLSALVMGMLNSFGRFAIPALSPALFNVGMIVSAFFLYDIFEIPIYALAIGVLTGGLGQLMIQLPPLFRLGFRFRFNADFLNPQFKKIIALFTPMVVGMSAGRINIIVSTLIASFMIEGAISYLSYAYRLMHFPLGVFAVALGSVALPRISELAAKGDKAAIGATFEKALRLNFFVIFPSAAFLFIYSTDIVELIFEHGAFTSSNTLFAAQALRHYAYGLIGFSAVRVTVPVYYALGDSRMPMKISLATVALNLLLYYPLITLYDFAGLASATSLAAIVNFGLLLYFMPRLGVMAPLDRILLSAFRMATAAALALFVSSLVHLPLPDLGSLFINSLLSLLLSMLLGGIFYFGFCFLLGENLLKLYRSSLSKN